VKYAALLMLTALPLVTLAAQDTETVQEPEYVGIVFVLDPAGTLSPLERQQENIQTKVRAFGYGGAQSPSVFRGPKSHVRFKTGQNIEFVVRLNISGIEPDRLVKLNILMVSKDQCEIIMAKVGSVGMISKSTTGESLCTLNFAKYGEQSLKFAPSVSLEPGEYAITSMDGQSGFLFGIDPQ